MSEKQPSVTEVFMLINEHVRKSPDITTPEQGREVGLWSLLVSREVTTNPDHKAFFKARMHELAQAGWFTDKVQVDPAVIEQSFEAIGAEIPDCLLSAAQEQEAAE